MQTSRSARRHAAWLLAACCLLALSSDRRVSAQPDTAAVDDVARRVRAHMDFLADDLLEGREAGTRGYDLAARYVATTLQAYGVRPAATPSSFFQAVPLRESRLARGELILQPRNGPRVSFDLPDDAVVLGNPGKGEIDFTAPVVFVGFGVTAPDQNYDDYAGADVRGRFVAVLADAPAQFSSELRAHHSSSAVKLKNAAEHGARGVLHIALPDYQKRNPWRQMVEFVGGPTVTWVSNTGEPGTQPREIEGRAYLSGSATERLFAGSPVPLDDVYEAAAKGAARPIALPVSVTIRATTEHRAIASANVLGLLEGRDAALSRSYVVLTAHLDHVGIGTAVNGDAIYNGAFDNASGCAVLLEVARRLAAAPQRPRRSVLFVFVTAEEKGLVGSDYFARNPTVPLESLVANVNLDMPLLQWPIADVVAFGAENSTLDAVVDRAARAAGLMMAADPLPHENLFVRSDQYSLVKQGVPAVFLMPAFGSKDPARKGGEAFNAFLARHYHKPSDDLSLPLDAGAVAAFTEANYLITMAIADDPIAPSWKPGNFFGTTYGRGR